MKEIYSRYWYVRTNKHLYDYDDGYIEIYTDIDMTEQEMIRRHRGKLFTLEEVRDAKKTLTRAGSGKPRAIRVTIYRNK